MLIFRPFHRKLVDGSASQGLALLLRVLRGEDVDWKALEGKFTPQRECAGCGEERFKDEYSSV